VRYSILVVVIGIGIIEPGSSFVIVMLLGRVIGETAVFNPGSECLLHAWGGIDPRPHQLILFYES